MEIASFVLLCVGACAADLQDGVMMGFIAHYTHNSELYVIRALSLIYTLYSSPLHTQSSLVVSWQRIYHSLTVTSNHT
jgi:hypothetical protein